MIQCPNCQANLVENTLVCNHCGCFLPEDDRHKTDPVGVDVGWLGEEKPGQTKSKASYRPDTTPLTLRLIIGPHSREVTKPLNKPVLIGRQDLASKTFPDVDLTDDGPLASAVSRVHAKIFKKDNIVFLEDTGSTNGTLLNGKRLAPHVPEPLKDDDVIQLGKLLVRVKIYRL